MKTKFDFNITLAKQGFILVLVPLVFELAFIGTLYVQLGQAQAKADRAEHARAMITTAGMLLKHFYEVGTVLMAYGKERNQILAAAYERKRQSIMDEMDLLEHLVANDAAQAEVERRIESLCASALELLDTAKDDIDKGGGTALLLGSLGHAQKESYIIQQMDREISMLLEPERRFQQANPDAGQNTQELLHQLLVAGVAISILLALGLAVFFNQATARRLAVLVDNTERLSRQEQLHPELSGRDELAGLDRTFHKMAVALAEAARKERAIVDNAVDVICSLDRHGKFTTISPAALTVWGYQPAELVGRAVSDLVVSDDHAGTAQAMTAALGGQAQTMLENRISKKDGAVVFMQWSINWVAGDGTADEGRYFCVVHDISERKELERFRQQLIAMVSHELRTPLTSVSSGLELLETGTFGELNAKGEKILKNASANVDRLISLIADLLDIERVEAGRLELHKSKVAARSLIDRSIDVVDPLASDKKITIAAPDASVDILADGNRLIQVFVNLLSNAIKFSPPGSTITVAVKVADGVCEFQVQDRGRGVPEEHKLAIFERFRQVEATDSSEKGGTGLGLPICKAIVEAHGGRIGVESQDGQGSVFWFTIPVES